MTIVCITNQGIPGIRPCTVRDLHRVTCRSHDGWAEDHRTTTCSGCFPREAHFGLLCPRCYDHLEAAWIRWPQFRAALAGVERAIQVDNAGRSSAAQGWVPFPGTFLAIDECESYLQSWYPYGDRGQNVLTWISTEQGARDAVQFTKSAERAYATHRTEEQERKLQRVRCTKCGQLSLVRKAPEWEGAELTVTCDTEGCGHVIHEDALTYGRVFQDTDGTWMATLEPTIDVLEAIDRRTA